MIYRFMVLWLSIFGATRGASLNITSYYEMPALFDFDDYDLCLRRFPQRISTYCLVRSDLVPDSESKLYQRISEHSSDVKRHFNHGHLFHGLCVEWCEQLVNTFNGSDDYLIDLQTSNYKINIYTNLFSSYVERGHREKYNNLLNQCVNYRLSTNYNLTAKTMIEYCITSRDKVENDPWNYLFFGVCLFIVTALSASSFYDLILKKSSKDPNIHYKTSLKSFGNQLFTSFSMARNWNRLTMASKSRIERDLRFLDCFKTCTFFIVICGHTGMIFFESAIINPFDLESLNHTFESSFLYTGCIVTLTFFVISGFLLAISYHKATTESTKKDSYSLLFIKLNVFRYVRLTIPYAVIVLITGVKFNNLGGPMWKHIVEKEQLACRNNWWLNLLYINNYVKQDETCMIHGWYLSADTQIYLVSLSVMIMGSKFPKYKNLIYNSAITLGIVLTGIIVYIEKFEGIFVPSLQEQKDGFIGSRPFRNFYTAPHINFSYYFIGIITAQLYLKVRESNHDFKYNQAFKVFWFALIPCGIFLMLLGYIFIAYEFEKPAIWIAVFGALQKNLWAFVVGVIIVGMSMKIGWIFRKFSCHPVFRVTGRLTYGVFLCHLWYLRVFIGVQRTPFFVEPNTVFVYVLFVFFVSNLSAFVLAMAVELPVVALMKLLLK